MAQSDSDWTSVNWFSNFFLFLYPFHISNTTITIIVMTTPVGNKYSNRSGLFLNNYLY